MANRLVVKFLFSCCLFVLWGNLGTVYGHGYMSVPTCRGCQADRARNLERDYDVNGLYCGGLTVQHFQNGGRCGNCGDNVALKTPRRHEYNGTYGRTGPLTYYKQGQDINVKIILTKNHLGSFDFSLCKLTVGVQSSENENCFKLLQFANKQWKYVLHESENIVFVRLRLPSYMTCKQCVLRWKYVAANNKGLCSDGLSRAECAKQETFMSCADISIQ